MKRILVVTTVAVAMLYPATAQAKIPGGSRGDGGGEDQSVSAGTSKVIVKTSGGNGKGSGTGLEPASGNWQPPACWYEPAFTPKQLSTLTDELKPNQLAWVSSSLQWGEELMRSNYEKGEEANNFNLKKQGKGKWWRGTQNPNHKDDPKRLRCDEIMFWVDEGDTPDTPQAVTPKILAEYAYEEVPIPDTKVALKPEDKSTVNLPTWMWLDEAEFQPVKATASLPGTGLSATTTAKPVSLHLDAGTKDAQVHPSTGECPINESGRIGTPYRKGNAEKTPPCGVTYKRATTNSPPHKLKATLTWEVEWEGSDGEGGDLPDGAFDTTQNITVQEVQAQN